jgi:hypothetical protein
MKVPEKSLELNVGAELLNLFRGPRRMPKAYLRGLIQRSEEANPQCYADKASRELGVFPDLIRRDANSPRFRVAI